MGFRGGGTGGYRWCRLCLICRNYALFAGTVPYLQEVCLICRKFTLFAGNAIHLKNCALFTSFVAGVRLAMPQDLTFNSAAARKHDFS